MSSTTDEVLAAIREERAQEADGTAIDDGAFSVLGWTEIMEKQLRMAGILRSSFVGRTWILRAIATGVLCLEQHGVPPMSTDEAVIEGGRHLREEIAELGLKRRRQPPPCGGMPIIG